MSSCVCLCAYCVMGKSDTELGFTTHKTGSTSALSNNWVFSCKEFYITHTTTMLVKEEEKDEKSSATTFYNRIHSMISTVNKERKYYVAVKNRTGVQTQHPHFQNIILTL